MDRPGFELLLLSLIHFRSGLVVLLVSSGDGVKSDPKQVLVYPTAYDRSVEGLLEIKDTHHPRVLQ